MHPTTAAFVEAAAALGLRVEPRRFPEGTRTAEDAAAAIGVDVGQIVKSLAFRAVRDDGSGFVVMALVSGRNRLDEAALALAAGADHTERADAAEVRAATGYAIGGVPPFGHATALPVFVDRDLLGYDEVWAAAGTPHDVFPLTPDELVRGSGGTLADLAR
ncbi:MAG: YbaK/EbsC family protein [Acidimicrobiales bacterium]|nr:YbaK/EbsC family protein [Acidimicrobiales bacterium]MCB1017669.1 YbaK/EbsC family protein [Acidimicrobiales bacterium]MCB9373595.1 YbaK/EbsC family protein [Microthrixaceae bacterium]